MWCPGVIIHPITLWHHSEGGRHSRKETCLSFISLFHFHPRVRCIKVISTLLICVCVVCKWEELCKHSHEAVLQTHVFALFCVIYLGQHDIMPTCIKHKWMWIDNIHVWTVLSFIWLQQCPSTALQQLVCPCTPACVVTKSNIVRNMLIPLISLEAAVCVCVFFKLN